MIDTLGGPFWTWMTAGRSAEATRAPKRHRNPPVFIHDAITPWRDETMLLRLLRDQADDDGDQP